jgi:hypothetical protein
MLLITGLVVRLYFPTGISRDLHIIRTVSTSLTSLDLPFDFFLASETKFTDIFVFTNRDDGVIICRSEDIFSGIRFKHTGESESKSIRQTEKYKQKAILQG